MNVLTILCVLFPFAAGSALFVWRPQDRAVRNRYALAAVCLNSVFVLGSALLAHFYGAEAMRFHVASLSPMLQIAFCPDGVGSVFGCIIGVLWPVTTVYAFSYMEHEGRENMFFGFFILTYGAVAGIAYAANFFTLYLCYEFMTLVTLPLVMHEMNGRARSAGKKYVLYSMTGAALVFICLMYFCRYADSLDFTLGGILSMERVAGHEKELLTVFVLAFFGFGVKAAIFPFHGWLPAASVAPTPVTALLHAVAVVKSGAFAVMRLIYFGFGCEFVRGTWAQQVVMTAAAFTVVFGTGMALRQDHLKRRLAYHTVSNLSYIILGFTAMRLYGHESDGARRRHAAPHLPLLHQDHALLLRGRDFAQQRPRVRPHDGGTQEENARDGGLLHAGGAGADGRAALRGLPVKVDAGRGVRRRGRLDGNLRRGGAGRIRDPHDAVHDERGGTLLLPRARGGAPARELP